MKILIVFAHPSRKSYNYGILQSAIRGLKEKNHELKVIDLYEMKFDPCMTEAEIHNRPFPEVIREEQAKVTWADLIICIFPVWWWGPPAILKGWLERVLCLNFAFKYDIKKPGYVGAFQDRSAVIISTGSSSPENYTVNWQLESHNEFVASILSFSGFSILKTINLYNIHEYTPKDELETHLNEVYESMKNL